MTRPKLQQFDAAVSGFITKANKKNEPLEAFRKTTPFLEFNDALKEGIRSQAKWAVDNLSEIHMISDEVTDTNQAQIRQNISTYIRAYMPLLSDYVSKEDLSNNLTDAFNYSVEAQYLRYGYKVKKSNDARFTKESGFITFELTNPNYLAALKGQVDVLLTKSSIDETTKKQMVALIGDLKVNDMATTDEIASILWNEFHDTISESRAFTIANTETNNAMSYAQHTFLIENQVATKIWVPAGASTCPVCDGNAEDGPIGVNDNFSSGDDRPAAHPNCECYLDGGEVNLDNISVWGGA